MGKRWSRPVRWFLFFAGLILVYQVACHMPLLVDGAELNSPENTNFVEWDVFGRIQSAHTVEIRCV